ncbi:MAG: hypothetical protein WHT06_13220 [Desulfobacterales bacterium]
MPADDPRKPSAFDAPADAGLEEALRREAPEGRLSCERAFALAERFAAAPLAVGRAADRLGVRLVRCQLGLFGYQPEKKIVRPAPRVEEALEQAIRDACVEERLPCRAAWEIAARFGLPRLAVSAACEALAVRIKPCQLGAF